MLTNPDVSAVKFLEDMLLAHETVHAVCLKLALAADYFQVPALMKAATMALDHHHTKQGLNCIVEGTRFNTDGFWDTALDYITDEVAKGQRTIVTVQFGHNDMKIGVSFSAYLL